MGLGIADYVVGGALLLAITAYSVSNRRTMMKIRIASTLSFGLSFLLNGAMSGFFGSLISCMGAITQCVTPDHLLQKTLYLRIGIAIFLACLGMIFIDGHAAIIPMIALIISRLSEVQSCITRIRFGYFIGQALWLYYAVVLGLTFNIVAEIILMTTNAIAMSRHVIQQKRTQQNLALQTA